MVSSGGLHDLYNVVLSLQFRNKLQLAALTQISDQLLLYDTSLYTAYTHNSYQTHYNHNATLQRYRVGQKQLDN